MKRIRFLDRETQSLSSSCGSLKFGGGHEDWREDSTSSLSSSSRREHESSFTKQGPATAAYHLPYNHNFCVHSVRNMPLRVSSGTSAQVKNPNDSMRIGAAISTVCACSKVNAIESSFHAAGTLKVSRALYWSCEELPKVPDTERLNVTTEILLYIYSA